MENKTEESDSDSSWIFLDENSPTEPTQEPIKRDLGIISSDVESDTDGISVISESDDNLNDFSLKELITADSQGISDTYNQEENNRNKVHNDDSLGNITQSDTVLLALKVNHGCTLKNVCTTTSLIGAGVVFVAVLIIPLMSNDIFQRNLKPYKDKIITEESLQTSFMPNSNNKREKTKIPLFTKTHVVKHKKRKYDNLLHSYQPTLDSIRSHDFIESKKSDRMLQYKELKSFEKRNFRIGHKGIIKSNKNFNNKYKGKKKHKRNQKNYADDHSYEINKKLERIVKKLRAKKEYLSKKEKYLMKKEYSLIMKERELQEKLIEYHKLAANKSKFQKCTKSKPDEYKMPIYSVLDNVSKRPVKNETEDGYWQFRLHNGRDEIRKQEQKAEWWFDRATMRLKLRDRAHWYFHWMGGREETRFRRDNY